MSSTVLILGATSAIARGAAHAFARRGHGLYLAARDHDELDRLAADLRIRHGVGVRTGLFDADAIDSHAAFFQRVVDECGDVQGMVIAFGYMGDPSAVRRYPESIRVITRNFTGAVELLERCADYFAERHQGFLVGISSVAGDRGRQSNYVYGAAKGGLSLYLQGLRNRLAPERVQVITVKPGFVDTAMTFGMPGLFLVASPEFVGEQIARAVDRSRDIVYIPWFWRYIMLIIRHIPEALFKRLKL